MLTILLRNQDLKEATIPVQLYMSVSNLGETYMLTKSPNITPPIHLTMGETKALTGKDLDCIFNTNYLTFKGTEFKENTNILKIYARDMRTGKVVSNTASITLKSVVIGAPKLLAPDNGIVIETDNPFHLFRWQGDNGGSHKATAYNYFYSLEIWRQNNNDPNVEAQRNPDFFADYLKAEQYQMLFSSYPFEIGQKYCWRVRAYDPTERTTFINEGKSEVRSFTYKHLPVPVTGLTHKIKETTRVATATWNSAEGHTKYYIEYYNPQTKKTISNTTNEPKYTLSAAPEGDYKILFRVKAQCWNDDNRQSSWTPWDTIHYTPRPHVESEYECGHKFPKVEITNYSLKTDFEEGDIVSEANGSSNYEIINCTADADSTLRGQFYLVMDAWGGTKIACDFWDTKINTDNVIITTRYRNIEIPGFVVDPDEIQRYVKSLWLDANSVATSSKIRDTIVIDEKFDYLYIADNGTLYAVVVNPDGTTNETAVHTNKSTSQCLITDGQGDSLVISQKGQVMGIQEYRTTGGNRALLNEIHRKSDSLAQWQINFISAKEQQVYAFDQIGSGNHGIFDTEEYYPKSGNYDFRYKSVESGQTDRVIVDFGSYPQADSVIFKDKYGVKLKVVDGNILTFTGVNQADTNFIYAYRGDQKIGKLFLNTYQRKIYKVVLVSVNKAKIVNINNIDEAAKIVKESLDKVYNQCAVQFEISTDEFTLNDLTTFSHGGSGILTVYNDDQKRLLSAYEKEKKMQDKTYYLFFVNNVTDKKDSLGTSVSGYMPRGYNAGFIYDGGSEHTIAHELGHGIAGLEHVFENSSNSGKTKNLMDYSFEKDAEQLWHFQWDQIQDPSRVWMKWNKAESEGENVEKKKGFFVQLGDVYDDLKVGNRFGYDDYDTKDDTNDDNVSVDLNGTTYLGVCDNKSLDDVTFVRCRNKEIEIIHFDIDTKKSVKVDGANFGEVGEYLIYAMPTNVCYGDDWKDKSNRDKLIQKHHFGSIHIDVYKNQDIEQNIYYNSKDLTDANITEMKKIFSKNLKYLVAKPDFKFEPDDNIKLLTIDKNNNNKIEHIVNNENSIVNEYKNLKSLISGNRIVLLKGAEIYDCWEFDKIDVINNTIRIPNLPKNKLEELYENHKTQDKPLVLYNHNGKSKNVSFYITKVKEKTKETGNPLRISPIDPEHKDGIVVPDLLKDEILEKIEISPDNTVYFTLKESVYNSGEEKYAKMKETCSIKGPHYYATEYETISQLIENRRKQGKMTLPLGKCGSFGSELCIEISVIEGTLKDHSASSEYIMDEKNRSLGFSDNENGKGAVVCLDDSNIRLNGETLLHEIMHAFCYEVFYDVNKEGNIMHSFASKYTDATHTSVTYMKIKVPFRHKPLAKVKTGTLEVDPSTPPMSQWKFREHIKLNN